MSTILHLRSETKPLEHRSALTPTTAKALLDAGYTIKVERSPVRIFEDNEFEAIGATLIDEGSWVTAPKEEIIIGLKELADEPPELPHVHIQFAHVYKNQGGWKDSLKRYANGGGTLLDLEFLAQNGRRVAAFGYHAGYCGAALAVKEWVWQLSHPTEPLAGVDVYTNNKGFYNNEDELLDQIKADLSQSQRLPRVLVIGALGRCGRGAVEFCQKVGIPEDQIIKWDMDETAKGGPFMEIVESDIFVNCIYLDQPIPKFIDQQSLSSPSRKLSVVCDVSCDTTNPNNPIPIYTVNTTFDSPTVPVEGISNPPLSVISIDHLPSLLPREASEAFSQALLPFLLQLKDWKSSPVWQDAEALYKCKVAELSS
ncbi:MAG: Saccharopine dehydrogenase [Vezdaea aestivalis]|nr:MAG: Saccharopine dehydrogenase [Vezdaea aestivalis]